MLPRILLHRLPAEALFLLKQFKHRVVDSVIMASGVRAVLRVALRLFHKTDFFFRSKDDAFEAQPFFPKQLQSFFRYGAGDGLGCQIEQLLPHTLSHSLNSRIYGGDGFSHPCRSFYEQLLLVKNGLVYIDHQFLLALSIGKGKFQPPYRGFSDALPFP